MRRHGDRILYSAGDVVAFASCGHHTTLSLYDLLDKRLARAEEDAESRLVQAKGHEHESAYLAELGEGVVQIPADSGLDARVQATRQAMANAAPVIYQAAFTDSRLVGYADFLRRVEEASELGAYSYEVLDTKLARSPRAKFIVQLCFYSELLANVQGSLPRYAAIVLGDGTEHRVHLPDYRYYFRNLLGRFLEHVQQRPETYPEPCDYCSMCPWRELCKERWERDDHLCRVADIRKDQIAKLREAGVTTMAALATRPESTPVPRLGNATLAKLHHQARLQVQARESGEPKWELLPLDPDGRRGFYRLPEPDAGDVFFDMESDPYDNGGLEYLFGVYYFDGDRPIFRPFWAHARDEEKRAFEAFIDFVIDRLSHYPSAHVYHYAHYEETALKRLMSVHGTREADVDDLLRRGKLVDLYKVVCEAMRVSEPSYSIKNLEIFYREERSGEVADAGASIVTYERWKETGDPGLLDDIRAYNEEDCRSTYELREWLLGLRPAGLPPQAPEAGDEAAPKSDNIIAHEKRLEEYRTKLLDDCPAEERGRRELVHQLLDFYRREKKPQYWAMFSRQDQEIADLIDDPETLGGLVRDETVAPETVKQSTVVTYRFPDQETKLRENDTPQIADSLTPAGTLVELDPERRRARLKRGNRQGDLPDRLSLIPGPPIPTDSLTEALFRYAESVAAGRGDFAALDAFLERHPPLLKGWAAKQQILGDDAAIPQDVVAAVEALDESYLFVQGPPGAGKTYTGSYVIAELINRGYRVGVSSNSHKAIDNLLTAVEGWARKRSIQFRGVKKSSAQNEDSAFEGEFVHSEDDKRYAVELALDQTVALVAGTAWFFATEELDHALDYLFLDEAGQVSLAHLVVMGTSASNIVLLGDQMQLGQPIQGSHPGRTGESTLDYLLDERATIDPGHGIFMPTTFRMHPDVCRFISDAMYDGRLAAHQDNAKQRVHLPEGHDPVLRPTGVTLAEVDHDGCSQVSEVEAQRIRELYDELIGQSYTDSAGKRHALGLEDVLAVAPYNMQVNLLKRRLPEGARVGTVDKFQGQEAQVVFVSMATSSGEYLPRHIDFLFSRNRLNVAISRARSLAVLVMNPELTAIACDSPRQMALVNTLCWAREYALSREAGP